MTPRKRKTGISRFVPDTNFNTALTSLAIVIGGYLQHNMSAKQDEALQKQKQISEWQTKRDSINKVTQAKLDSILLVLKKKK